MAPKPFKPDPLAKARAAKAAKAEAAKSAAETSDLPATEAGPRPHRARKPFGTPEAKLAWPPREGYKRRWFNDKPGRVARALEAGYTHVEEHGKPVSRVVDPGEQGGGLHAYLMEIPEEWYDEDFAKKQEAIDEIDKAIYRGKFKEEDGDRRYIPSTGIKVSVQRGS